MEQYTITKIQRRYQGKIYTFPIGALAKNVKTDDERQFVTKKEKMQIDKIATIEQAFQDGCDLLVSTCTTYGETPKSNSPEDISEAIGNIYNKGYADGFASAKDAASIEFIYHSHVDGKNNEYNNNSVLYSTTDPGGCFVASGHTHNKTGTCNCTVQKVVCGHMDCISRANGYSYFRCNNCGYEESRYDGGASEGWGYGDHYKETTVYSCGDPINTWKLGCGKTTETIEQAIINFEK